VTTESAVEAAQAALAAEHVAVYAYGVAGGVLDPSGPEAVRVRSAYEVHRARRDGLETTVRSASAEPAAAEAGYALDRPVRGPAGAVALARTIEDRCAATYAALVAASTGALRSDAVGWLGDAATRGLSWGAAPTAFPGLAPAPLR